jgi:hypothetical integral membrane protein (TIGR02206 family)
MFLLRENQFDLFGTTHAFALLFFVLGAIVLVAIGRSCQTKRQEELLRRGLVIASIAIAVSLITFNLISNGWDINHSLPFHLCDTAYLLAHYALWTRKQWAFSILFYWGLTLTPQALVTPFLPFDVPHVKALMFWGLHFFVVWAAVLMTWGFGMRPRWENFKQVSIITVCFMALIFGFNAIFGTNYLYLNYKPENPSLIDWLGPWPIYPFVMAFIGISLWALISLPYRKKKFWPLDFDEF